MKRKIWITVLVLLVAGGIYYAFSSVVMNGNVIFYHYFCYDSMEECKRKGVFITDKLDIKIETKNDSLGNAYKNSIEKDVKFWLNKAMYQKAYGALFYRTYENKELYTLQFEDNSKNHVTWDFYYKEKPAAIGFILVERKDTFRTRINISLNGDIGTIYIKIPK